MFNMTFMCCFCGEGIEEGAPYNIVLVYPNEEEQVWFTHRECFENSLTPKARYFKDEE
jgi:hypothetical protein